MILFVSGIILWMFGMQNSGLGVALATAHFSPLAALPSVWGAIWHNISGPILATIWSKKSTDVDNTVPNLSKAKDLTLIEKHQE